MKTVIIILFTLLSPCLAFGWYSNGHMTGGAIAYYHLKQTNPAVMKSVVEALKKHVFYKTEWKHEIDSLKRLYEKQWKTVLSPAAAAELEGVLLFMLASKWPDDVRDSFPYGTSTTAKWHYIDNPFVPRGQPTPPDSVTKMQVPNVETKLRHFLDTIRAQTDSGRAIDLCWLMHLVEDLHEPMHTVGMFDSNHPQGDAGGNFTFFRMVGVDSNLQLHAFWDGLIPGPMNAIPLHAQWLLSLDQYQVASLPELRVHTTVDEWIKKESYPLAVTHGYLNGYINGIKGKSPAPLVDRNYLLQAEQIGEKQIVLAGIRLAGKLVELYSKK